MIDEDNAWILNYTRNLSEAGLRQALYQILIDQTGESREFILKSAIEFEKAFKI